MRSEERIGLNFGVIVAGSVYPPGFKAKCGVARRVVEGGIVAMCPECEIGCYIFHIVLTLGLRLWTSIWDFCQAGSDRI